MVVEVNMGEIQTSHVLNKCNKEWGTPTICRRDPHSIVLHSTNEMLAVTNANVSQTHSLTNNDMLLHHAHIINANNEPSILNVHNSHHVPTNIIIPNQLSLSLHINGHQTQPITQLETNLIMFPTNPNLHCATQSSPNHLSTNMHKPHIQLLVHLDITIINQKNMTSNHPHDLNQMNINLNPNNTTNTKTLLNVAQTKLNVMGVRTERKRRSEEVNIDDINVNEIMQYILSAGPGNQDCQDL